MTDPRPESELPRLDSRGLLIRSPSPQTNLNAGPSSGLAQGKTSNKPRKIYTRDIQLKLSQVQQKLQQQDRVNAYIMDQLNRVQSRQAKQYSKGPSQFDQKRLQFIQNELRRQQSDFSSLQHRLRQTFQQYSTVNSRLKNIQKQEDTELSQIRVMLQEKMSSDHRIQLKNKEKAQVLFGEVVRLGGVHQKSNEFLQNLSVAVEKRLGRLQNQRTEGDRTVATLNTQNDSNVNMLIELAEKVDNRVKMLERALHSLNSEQERDHQTIDKIESGAIRLQDDIKSFLRQLQGDIQHRLELKMSEVLNRLLQQQEERLRNHQDLKYSFETREKLTNDKIQYNRDQFNDKISTLENFVKTELQRKDQLINHIKSGFQKQVKSVFQNLKQQQQDRQNGQNELHDQISQVSDAARDAIEQYNAYQTSITDKMTQMVKTEIDCRLKAEKQLKNLTQNTMKGVMQQISILKQTVDRNRTRAEYQLRQAQNSFAQKADLLSRYIQDQVKRVGDLMRVQHQQTKQMIVTLTESLKHTIISTQKFKQEIQGQIGEIQAAIVKIQEEQAKSGGQFQAKLLYKMKELQASLESHLASNGKILEQRIETLANIVDTSLNSFEGDIKHNRQVFSGVITQLNQDIADQHSSIIGDLNKLLAGLDSLQSEIDSVSEDVNEKISNMENQVSLTQSNILVQISTEKLLREHMLSRVTQQFEEQIKNTKDKTQKLEDKVLSYLRKTAGQEQTMQKKFQEVNEQITKTSQAVEVLEEQIAQQTGNAVGMDVNVETNFVMQDILAKVEAQDLLDQIKALNLETDMKQMENRGQIDMQNRQLQEIQENLAKAREENKEAIAEAFDQKIAALQQKMQQANAGIWNEIVNSVGETPQTQESLEDLKERIVQIASRPGGNFQPSIRYG